MMKAVAIILVLTSMAVAAADEKVAVKGGRRAVEAEHGENAGDGNTKVSFTPPLHWPKGFISSPEERLATAAAAVAGVAQDPVPLAMEGGGEVHGGWPRELLCDAVGKCKHKIASALNKAKSKVTSTVEEVEEGAKDTAGAAVGKAKVAASKAAEIIEESTLKAKDAGDVAEETAEKALSEAARRGGATAYAAARYIFSTRFLSSVVGVAHLAGFAAAFGAATWVTFAMNHVLAATLPRRQLGVVQSRMCPVYFKAVASGVGSMLVGFLAGWRRWPTAARGLQGLNLGGCFVLAMVNLVYLEPRATKVMFERMKLEKEEGRGISPLGRRSVDHALDTPTPTTTTSKTFSDTDDSESKMARLSQRLGILNSCSSMTNVATLAGLAWHLVYLSQCLNC